MKSNFIKIIATLLTLVVALTSVLTACGTEAKGGNFYVKYGGTGDGLTPENPAGSVNAVKSAVNSSLTEGDIANVWIMQDDAEDFNPLDFGNAERKTHKMTVWKNSGEESISHTAKIVVSTYVPEGETEEETNNAYLAFSESIAKNTALELTGPTEFKNVTIVPTASTDTIELSGHNAVLGDNVFFRSINLEDGQDYSDLEEVPLVVERSNFTTSLVSESDTVIENALKVTFDNKPHNDGVFYVPSKDIPRVKFNGDVTIEYKDQNLASLQIVMGAGASEENTDYSAHFYGNLNVKMKKGDAIKVSPGATNVRIDGGAQFIVDPKTSYYTKENIEHSFKNLENLKTADQNGKMVNADKWILYIDSAQQDYIDFVEGEAGKYTVADGYMAVATHIDGGEEIKSSWGKLTLENSGEYNVSVTKNFTNNGEIIKVYKRGEIDLGKVSHTEKDGYAFIGWKTDKGEFPQRTEKFSKGTVLTAQYVKIDFSVEDNKINQGDAGDHDLVFVLNKSKKFWNGLPKPLEYGSIYLPTDATLGAQMYINEPVTFSWKWDKETGLDFEPVATGRTPLRVKAWKLESEKSKGDAQEYTLTVEDIDPDNYYTWYTVRGYIIYEDYNGLQRIVYSLQDNPDFENGNSNFDNDQSCIYEVAKETPESERGDLENEIIKYVEVDREEYYNQGNGILEYYAGYTGKGLKDQDPNHKIYKLSNGLLVRDVTIDTHNKNTEKTEICFISDTHFSALDKRDIEENITNAISSYRGRDWTRNIDFRNKSLNYMEYASMFPKTVIGGDAVDYWTYGAIGTVSRLLVKKSVNGSIKMVLGNHDPSELSQNDISGLSNINPIEERYKMLNNNWTNDVEYSSEIMKTKDGKDNIMLIYIDNGGRRRYTEKQLKKFKADIKTAREKNIPVLMFQHIPIITHNPQETELYYSADGKSFGTANNSKNNEMVDMTSFGGYLGDHKNADGEYYYDETTRNLYNEIRKSADVIKGIFCGHTHENSYTEIVGCNEDGTDNNLRIPQHNSYSAYNNGVMKITVQ